jgi:hypothetical protein
MSDRNSDAGYVLTSIDNRFQSSQFSSWISTEGATVIFIAALFRLLSIPFSVWQINPYSQADAAGFARRAATIGHGFVAGENLVTPIFPAGATVSIYDLWGLLLSPFWVLPGPSSMYAYIGVIVLGVLTVYNVYAIAQYYHSPLAGGIAALPVAIYPSFVLAQSSLLREGAVLAGITTAAHLLVRSPSILDDRRRTRSVLIVSALVFAAFLRYDNVPVYSLALGVGFGVWYVRRHELDTDRRALVGSIVGVTGISGLAIAPRVVNYLAEIHRRRARGRTAYLTESVPTTVPEAIVFAPVGMAYFLFTPFPWMITNLMDAVIALEALANVCFAIAGVWGIRVAWRSDSARTAALLTGLLVAGVLYGIASANVGTAVRHRQMFIWVVYVFGAVGITQWLGMTRIAELLRTAKSRLYRGNSNLDRPPLQ